MTGQNGDKADNAGMNDPVSWKLAEDHVLVSVIIPVYNCGTFISETLDSIVSQKNPGNRFDMEIIVVDDGSTDGTVETVRGYVNQTNLNHRKAVAKGEYEQGRFDYVNHIKPINVKLIPNENRKGAAGARNTGIDAASGRYITFIDADDKWLPDKLSRQLDMMRRTRAAFSFTGYEFADEDCNGTGKVVRVPERISYRQALKNTTIFTSTVMFDMGKLSKEDVHFPYVESEDTANWWKILRNNCDAHGLDEVLTLYRRSGVTLSSNKMLAIKRTWRLYRRVEGLSLPYSLYCFAWYAVRAVMRRI